jgi:hypothetical protein
MRTIGDYKTRAGIKRLTLTGTKRPTLVSKFANGATLKNIYHMMSTLAPLKSEQRKAPRSPLSRPRPRCPEVSRHKVRLSAHIAPT